jgi:hypothetical protein
MTASGTIAAETVRAAYVRAVAGGANIHVAFDLACKAYRDANPSADEAGLRQTVAAELRLPRQDAIVIEIGASA